MKKLFSFAVLALTFALAGCTKDPAISVDEDVKMLYASAEGGVFTFTLNANREWIAEILPGSNATVTVDPDLGVGPQEVTLTVAENLSANTLETTVRFTCGTAPALASVDVTIKQAGLTSVTWGGVEYPVKKLADGSIWFTQNLRYVPEGKTVSSDLSALDNGVWYPVDCVAKTLTENADSVARKGYLYSTEAALGLAPGTLNDENCLSYEGAQGICPPGWHIPTLDEIANLVGRVAMSKYDLKGDPGPVATAPYWDKEAGTSKIALANADGFNIKNTTGYINAAATATKGSAIVVMTYILSSTAYVKDGAFNKQFYGIMPAATYGGSCNGGTFNYRGGATVRCIKTKLSGTPL